MRSMWQRMTARLRDETGAATAEYAIVIMAAVGTLVRTLLAVSTVQACPTPSPSNLAPDRFPIAASRRHT
jgi:Flp pilus assembly pilin Flp